MSTPAEKTVLALANSYLPESHLTINLLKGDGSDRKIFLIQSRETPDQKLVGIYHEDLQENLDFIQITKKMEEASLPVPQILAVDQSNHTYLLQYLGENNLGQQIDLWLAEGNRQKIIQAYLKVLP